MRSAVFQVKQWQPDLMPAAVSHLQWQLQRVVWDWYYDRSANRWRYRQEIKSRVVAKGHSRALNTVISSLVRSSCRSLDWGRYALTV